MYAPYGTGALIGPKAIFAQGGPDYTGGGTVEVVTIEEVYWAGPPDRDEAGSPNVVGAVAMAAAAQALMEVGMDTIAAHEEELIAYTLEQWSTMPGIQIYGDTDPARARKSRRHSFQSERRFALPGGGHLGLRGRHRRAQRLLLRPPLRGAFT